MTAQRSSVTLPARAYGGRPTKPAPIIRFVALVKRLEPAYQAVIERAFFEPEGRWDKFIAGPSSRAGHHCGLGGNLVHTVEVAELCVEFAGMYSGLVDEQVLLVSALLHDLGKVEEYQQLPSGVAISDCGRWIGHKMMGCMLAWEAVQPLFVTHKKQALAILNSLSSSETRSFELRGRASLEAVLLSKADQISAAANLYSQSFRRGQGRSFYGFSHPHLREQPMHPLAETAPVNRSYLKRADAGDSTGHEGRK